MRITLIELINTQINFIDIINIKLSNWYADGFSPFINRVKPALNAPFIKRNVLNGNIFMSSDFGTETDVKYPGLNGNCLTW
jgi:hypothetical protein